jgi:hypothetical protein
MITLFVVLGSSRRRSRDLRKWIVVPVFTLAVSAFAHEGVVPKPGDPNTLVAVRALEPPKIDGILDESFWAKATPVTEFLQREQNEGDPGTERTEIRVAFDDTNLYIGAKFFDRNPDLILANGLEHDATLRPDDSFSFMVDTFHDHRTGFFFGTNPNGMRVEVLQLGESQRTINREWDCVWWSSGKITELGWSLEARIPFRSLRFNPQNVEVWGIGFRRYIPRKNEMNYWPFISRQSSFYRPAAMGHLIGLETGIKPGRAVEILPHIVGGAQRDYEPDTSTDTTDADWGVDLKWAITPNLTADMTYNTDFAQIEADQEVVNLTRFSLFFPEKRDFFLEGGRFFDFGKPRQAQLYFSRRIGLNADRVAVPVKGGGRISGKAGDYRVGFLTFQTDDFEDDPSRNFTVARVRRDIFSRSSIGAIFTHTGTKLENDSNQVLGTDSQVFIGDNLSFDGFLAKTKTPGIEGGDWGGMLAGAYNSDRYLLAYEYMDLDPNFNAEVGFVPRVDMRRQIARAAFRPRPRLLGLRQLHFNGNFTYLTNQEGQLESRFQGIDNQWEFESGERLTFFYRREFERLFEPFDIREDYSIPAGDYSMDTFGLSFSTHIGRPYRASIRIQGGDFWDGDKQTLSLTTNLRMHKHLLVYAALTHNRVDLPGTRFNTTVVSTRWNVNFTTDLFFRAFIQWNSDTRQVLTNLRLNFIHTPGSDLFVVYNETRDGFELGYGPLRRTLAVKFTYLFNL